MNLIIFPILVGSLVKKFFLVSGCILPFLGDVCPGGGAGSPSHH